MGHGRDYTTNKNCFDAKITLVGIALGTRLDVASGGGLSVSR